MDAVDEAVGELTPLVGVKAACAAVGLPRASYYRAHPAGQQQVAPPSQPQQPSPPSPPQQPSPPSQPQAQAQQRRAQRQPRALTEQERAEVLAVLHSERFADAAPAAVYATLLDEGTYLASTSTMYRLLRARGETGDRRRHATHPATVKPELVAAAPNVVWSWDITKLHGPAKWTYFYLYVILDIFSRYPVLSVVDFADDRVAGNDDVDLRRCRRGERLVGAVSGSLAR
jgi:putative transposase